MKYRQIFLLSSCFYLYFFSTVILASPQRIVSLNLCADQLLMALLSPKKLVGITNLATDPSISYAYKKASVYQTHSGRVEDIIALQPDLIIAGQFTSSATNQLLKELGYPVVTLGLPQTMAGIIQQLENLSEQVGATEKAKPLIAELKTSILELQKKQLSVQRKRAAIYYANGFSAGKETITHEILQLAGYNNIAAEHGLNSIAPLGLETLLSSRPDVLILGQSLLNNASLAHQLLQHKAIKVLIDSQGVKTISVPERLWNCAGPSSIAAAKFLAKTLE